MDRPIRLVFSNWKDRSDNSARKTGSFEDYSTASTTPSVDALKLATQLDQLRNTRPNVVAAIERLVDHYLRMQQRRDQRARWHLKELGQ